MRDHSEYREWGDVVVLNTPHWRRVIRFFSWLNWRKAKRLVYCGHRCSCGALYAYDPRQKSRPTAWDCSDILLAIAVPSGHPGAVQHDDVLPFVFYKVKSVPTDWALSHRKVAA